MSANLYRTFANGHQIAVDRSHVDDQAAPKDSCDNDSYQLDPESHRYCCRPHDAAEAETSDWIAQRRDRGEMNPATWPPIRDVDQFDVLPSGTRRNSLRPSITTPRNEELTLDDLE